jgi:hypothetical protein
MTSTLDVAKTPPTRGRTTNNSAFVFCGGLVGCAAFILLALVAIRVTSGTDPNWGAVVALWFFGGVIGLLTGVSLAVRCRDHNPSLLEALAPVVYLLTALAVPFLVYVAFAMLVISALKGGTS